MNRYTPLYQRAIVLTSFDNNNLMEDISSTFLKHTPVSADDLKAHAANVEAQKAKGGTEDLPEAPSFYQTVESKDLQAPYYVAVLFTAEYAPPCIQFLPQFESFME